MIRQSELIHENQKSVPEKFWNFYKIILETLHSFILGLAKPMLIAFCNLPFLNLIGHLKK